MRRSASTLSFALIAAGVTSAASAGVLEMDGTFDLFDSPPSNLNKGVHESHEYITVFGEVSNFQLPSDLKVNISTPGLFDSRQSLTPTKILAGTHINSYFLHGDNDESFGSPVVLTGTITFEEPILGVIIRHKKLKKSDFLVGHEDVEYGHAGDRALGFRNDFIWVSEDMRTVTLQMYLSGGRDHVRIITQGVPGPGALALLAVAGAALGRRRARRRA